MVIPKELMEKWEVLTSRGDLERISEQSDISRETIRKALVDGECTDKVFKAIADFYKSKQEMIEQYHD